MSIVTRMVGLQHRKVAVRTEHFGTENNNSIKREREKHNADNKENRDRADHNSPQTD